MFCSTRLNETATYYFFEHLYFKWTICQGSGRFWFFGFVLCCPPRSVVVPIFAGGHTCFTSSSASLLKPQGGAACVYFWTIKLVFFVLIFKPPTGVLFVQIKGCFWREKTLHRICFWVLNSKIHNTISVLCFSVVTRCGFFRHVHDFISSTSLHLATFAVNWQISTFPACEHSQFRWSNLYHMRKFWKLSSQYLRKLAANSHTTHCSGTRVRAFGIYKPSSSNFDLMHF